MSSALLDALMPQGPPRTPDASPRAGESGRSFAPVLNKAIQAEKPAPVDDEAPPADEQAAGATDANWNDASSQDGDAGDVVAAAAGEGHGEEQAGDHNAEDGDAAEISEAAAVAAAEAASAAAAVSVAAPAPVKANAAVTEGDDATIETVARTGVTGEADPNANAPTPPTPGELGAAPESLPEASDEEPAPITTAERISSTPRAQTEQIAAQASHEAAPRRATAPTPHRPQRSAEPPPQEQPIAAEAAAAGETGAKAVHETAIDAEASDQGDAQPTDGERVAPRGDSPAAQTIVNSAEPVTDVSLPKPTDNAGAATSTRSSDAVVAAASAAPEATPSTRAATTLARLAADRAIHTNNAANGDEAGAADRARFVGRVEGAVRAAHQRDGRVQVRLSPPELGSLRIELTIHQGALSARLEAETPAARNLLLDNLPALRDRLAQQDIRVERFDVDLRQDTSSGGGSGHNGANDRPARESDWRQNQTRSDRPRSASPAPHVTTRSSAAVSSDAALDVRV